MISNSKIEARIWKEGILSQDEDSLHEVIWYVAKRLGDHLGRNIEILDVNVERGVGANCAVYAKSETDSPVEVEWDCTIHMRLPEDYEQQYTQIYANLLAFSGNKRIGLQEHDGQSVLYLRYCARESQTGEWGQAKWHKDDYGDWEGYEAPSWSADVTDDT